jgi:hypothetical protein
MVENRQHQRKKVHILVMRSSGLPALGTSRDLSLGGIFVKGWHGTPGEESEIVITDGTLNHACKAKLVRVDKLGAAFQFQKPTSAFLQVVSEILAQTYLEEDSE